MSCASQMSYGIVRCYLGIGLRVACNELQNAQGVRRQIEVKTPPRMLPSSDLTLPKSTCESLLTGRDGSGSLSV